MRREPYDLDSIVHVVKRGTRGSPIVKDNNDRWRFLLMLRHFNDTFSSEDWFRDLQNEKIAHTLNRPSHWPKQQKLVHVLCFCLLDNHFHLLLKEITEGGISKFMQRLGGGMSLYFNSKYHERGSIFQGAYHSKTVDEDTYLQYVSVYIQVKNAFELYRENNMDFNSMYEWASHYPYCSLGNYAGKIESPIINKNILHDVFSPKDYKDFARDFVISKTNSMSQESTDIWSKIELE